MNRLFTMVRRAVGCEEAQDLLEYAMLIALIGLVGAVAVKSLGDTINTVLWQYIAGTAAGI
jgi:hypothetical protein